VVYTSLLREKCGGVLENGPLDRFKQLAKEANMDIRKFKPENGESWEDVMDRCKLFIELIIKNHVKNFKKS
jgi:broad specificity phosphatase PhoE